MEEYIYNLSDSFDTQFNMNCTDFSVQTWKSLNLIRSVAAMIAALIILAILIFLLYFKSYSTLLQRLYLYLIIATLLNEIAGIISIDHQWRYPNQETLCVWVGFFTGWTHVVLFIFSYEIIFYLLYLVVSMRFQCEIRMSYTRCLRWFVVIVREIVFFSLPVVVSTAYALPPYEKRSYGIAGPWCFVRSLNNDCEPIGKNIQLAFYSMYWALGVSGIAASLIFLVVYFKLSNSYKEARHLLKRTLLVLAFSVVHILMITCSIACRIYTLWSQRHELLGLWVTHALVVPLGALVFPLGYLLCFHQIAQIVYRNIVRRCCTCEYNTSVNDEEQSRTLLRATAPTSSRISQPSSTFFIVPHPDELS